MLDPIKKRGEDGMDLLPNSDEQQLIDMAAGFLAKTFPVSRLHGADEGRYSSTMAHAFAELGWFGMGLSEEDGGFGFTIVDEMLLFREMGRHLAPLAILVTSLAARTAAAFRATDIVTALLTGEATAALAIPDPNDERARLFECADADYILSLEGDTAHLLPAAALTIDPLPCLDKSIVMGRALVDPSSAVASAPAAPIEQAGRLLSAAMLVGACEAMTDMITEYAKIRETFGKAIGVNQAVRHPIADMAVRGFAARCQLFLAAASLRDGTPDAGLQIDAAKALANDAAIRNADANMQLHGGISTTEEHDSHFYMKRAHVLADLFGNRTVLDRIVLTPLAA
jgi:alkylation response protein AidB-like acyl-CoA dehydrogenase